MNFIDSKTQDNTIVVARGKVFWIAHLVNFGNNNMHKAA